MTGWIWLNGEIIQMFEARISVEDRGFQFADGVYEVIRLYNGKPFTLIEHLQRLERSAGGIQLALPMPIPGMVSEIHKLLAHAPVTDGMIYLQLTRGVAPRSHVFSQGRPTLLFYARPLPPMATVGDSTGIKLITVPDERWKRCWIKSIALLPNVLAKTQAANAGADEAVFMDEGKVTECGASNLFAVMDGNLVTHPVGPKVLPGITRAQLLELAGTVGLTAQERAFTEDEALAADEMFITSTTREISWVASWNGKPVCNHQCGPKTKKLHAALREKVLRETT